MSKIEVNKVCQFCGKEFIAHKLSTRFCSHQCSQRSYKVRLREQKLEKVLHQENIPNISPTTLKKEYLSCEDVAELMGISSTTVFKYGNKTYFSKKHIYRRFSLFTIDPDISEWYYESL